MPVWILSVFVIRIPCSAKRLFRCPGLCTRDGKMQRRCHKRYKSAIRSSIPIQFFISICRGGADFRPNPFLFVVRFTHRRCDVATVEEQVLVDATENDAAARYDKRREFASLVADATKRAEAMKRLELTLHYRSGHPGRMAS
jgi:hypothetical protein